MQAQHDTKTLSIKVISSSKIGCEIMDSISTIGGQKTNNWARSVREIIARKYSSPDINTIKKMEIKICQF